MKRLFLTAAMIGALGTSVRAQGQCQGLGTIIDPCLVGFWVGENTAAERVGAMLDRLVQSGVSRDVLPVIPAALGISIMTNGYYMTQPLQEWQGYLDTDERGETALTTMQLTVDSQFGFISALDGYMTFCAMGSGPAVLRETFSTSCSN